MFFPILQVLKLLPGLTSMKLSLSLCLVPAVTPPLAPVSLGVRMIIFPSLPLPPALTNNVKTQPKAGPPVPSI